MAESGGTFWAAGFWADGFWADGFWAGGTVVTPRPFTAAGGGAPHRKRREKRKWTLDELQNPASLRELHRVLNTAGAIVAQPPAISAIGEPEPSPEEIALMASIAEFLMEDG